MLEMVAALVVVEEQVELMFHTPMHKQELEQVLAEKPSYAGATNGWYTRSGSEETTGDEDVRTLQIFGMELRYMMELMQMQI